jgi:hypothetical protein
VCVVGWGGEDGSSDSLSSKLRLGRNSMEPSKSLGQAEPAGDRNPGPQPAPLLAPQPMCCAAPPTRSNAARAGVSSVTPL